MANFLDKTGLISLWRRIKEALPFVDVSVSGENNGWCKVAVITCGQAYMNRPFVFHLLCRGFPASSVEIMLASQNGTTPGVLYFVHMTTLLEGSHGTSSNVGYTYADVDGVRTYTLWKKKNEIYGTISVHAECIDNFSKYISYPKGISYTEPEGIVYADERYDSVEKQTVYTAKGSATKIPQITTNKAGQVMRIDEVDLGNAPTATKPLATRLTSSNDLNDIKGDGVGVYWYYWASASVPTNAHSSATAYMEVVRMHDGNYLFQTVYEANSSHLYRRQCRNGTWDAWYGYAKSSTTLSGYGITNAYTKTEVDGLLDDKLDNDGDGSSLTETFTVASTRANIESGKSNATIFGKIAKWLSDLKALAFKDKVGVGDVESGTYGISVSGNAGTATTATNASITRTADTTNGDKLQIGTGTAVNITNAKHAASADSATSATNYASSGGIATALSDKVPKTMVTSLADWNTLKETGIYEIESQASNVAHSPESGKLGCYVTVAAGYVTQLAVGDKVYKRCMPAKTQVWESWVALQDSSGLTVNELYTTSAGGYIDIHGATIEAGGPAGTTEISGGGITTPKVNGIALNMQTDTAAAIPASANDKLNDVTHLLVNGNKTLKLSEMVENKSYVFHVVSNGAVVSVYNDSSSAYTVRHRGSNISLAINSSASLNSSTDPAGEIWLARIGTNIYMSKSCEAGTVQDSLKWNGYSLSLGGTPTAGSGTIYFT